ncbi:hypothetical protein [Sorangium sp. So ce394]|uniref:hypothetical protein n=1 Tax=Sorangium sp. So ce394 TaxID=3133310 RepID=UPI003F5CA1E5
MGSVGAARAPRTPRGRASGMAAPRATATAARAPLESEVLAGAATRDLRGASGGGRSPARACAGDGAGEEEARTAERGATMRLGQPRGPLGAAGDRGAGAALRVEPGRRG